MHKARAWAAGLAILSRRAERVMAELDLALVVREEVANIDRSGKMMIELARSSIYGLLGCYGGELEML